MCYCNSWNRSSSNKYKYLCKCDFHFLTFRCLVNRFTVPLSGHYYGMLINVTEQKCINNCWTQTDICTLMCGTPRSDSHQTIDRQLAMRITIVSYLVFILNALYLIGNGLLLNVCHLWIYKRPFVLMPSFVNILTKCTKVI